MAAARGDIDAMQWLEMQPGTNEVSKEQIDDLKASFGDALPDLIEQRLVESTQKDFSSAEDDEIYEAIAILMQEPSEPDTAELTEQGSVLESMDADFSEGIPMILFEDPGLEAVMEELGDAVATVLRQAEAALDDEGREYLSSLLARYLYDEIHAGLVEAMQENEDDQGAALSEVEIRDYMELPDAW